jgi:hypothetical protein
VLAIFIMHVDMRITGPARFLRDDAATARDDLETKWADVCYHVNLGKSPKEVRWRSWLSHLSNTQKVPGSNPGRTIFFDLNRLGELAISLSTRRVLHIILQWTRATSYMHVFFHMMRFRNDMREMDNKLPPVSQSFLQDLSSPSSRDEAIRQSEKYHGKHRSWSLDTGEIPKNW